MIESVKKLHRRRLTSLLGLALDGSRLEAQVVRRTNGSLQVQQSLSVALSLDPLTADPDLVGREIRNQLDGAGIRERLCVVGLPLKWALTTHVEVPPLPDADGASFLQIEAERGFPCDAATLQVSTSKSKLEGGKQYALLSGVPRTHLASLERVLRAAKLKPVSFSLAIAALQPARDKESQGVLALAVGETHVALQITCLGGIIALRALEGALETESGRRVLHADIVAREARITLAQLPSELRDMVRQVRVFGVRDLAQQLADEMELRLEPLGLKVDLATNYAPGAFGPQLPRGTAVSSALSLAAGKLTGRENPFEFLPPRVSPLQQLANRYSSGKLGVAGAAAAALLVLICGGFLWQQWQLARLKNEWTGMAQRVQQVEAVRQQIRLYRPWYDENVRGLTILNQLTKAFPEAGVVSAKSVEIRDLSVVTCTGLTRDYQALLKTLEQLRASKEISEVRLSTIRGKSPMQFTFDFHWGEGGRSEN